MDDLRNIVAVEALEGHRLRLRFDDGVTGEVDLSSMIDFRGIFAELSDPERFAEVQVDPELGTVVWPNGADLDPMVLYCAVTGSGVPGRVKATV